MKNLLKTMLAASISLTACEKEDIASDSQLNVDQELGSVAAKVAAATPGSYAKSYQTVTFQPFPLSPAHGGLIETVTLQTVTGQPESYAYDANGQYKISPVNRSKPFVTIADKKSGNGTNVLTYRADNSDAISIQDMLTGGQEIWEIAKGAEIKDNDRMPTYSKRTPYFNQCIENMAGTPGTFNTGQRFRKITKTPGTF